MSEASTASTEWSSLCHITTLSPAPTTRRDAEQLLEKLVQTRNNTLTDDWKREYSIEELDSLVETLSSAEAVEEGLLEARLVRSAHIVWTGITSEGDTIVDHALYVATQAADQGAVATCVVGYFDARPFYAGRLAVDSHSMYWPEEKALIRFVQCTHDLCEPLPLHESLKTSAARSLLNSVNLRDGEDDNDPPIVVPPSLADVVSTLAISLFKFCVLERDSPTNTISLLLEELDSVAKLIGTNEAVSHVIFDLLALARSGKDELAKHLMSTSAHVFFVACVADSLSRGVVLKDALKAAAAYSRAVYILRTRKNLYCPPEDLHVYKVFDNEGDARIVHYNLIVLLQGSDKQFSTLCAPAPPRAFPADGIDLRMYEELSSNEVLPDGAFIKPGSGKSRFSTSPHTAAVEHVQHGDIKTKYTAVILHGTLYATVTDIRPPWLERARQRLRRAISNVGGGANVPAFGLDVAVGINQPPVDRDVDHVVNNFISGECGLQAAKWMFDRLVDRHVVLSHLSTSNLARVFPMSTERDAPVLHESLCEGVLMQLPLLFNTATRKTMLVVHGRNPLEVVQKHGFYHVLLEPLEAPEATCRRGVFDPAKERKLGG